MKSIYIMILIVLASGCQEKMYRTVVPATRNQIKMNPYGAYVELTPVSGEMKIGEALALVNDTLYLLGAYDVMKIPADQIKAFQLILTRHAASNYLKMGAFMTIPTIMGIFIHTDYAENFAVLGLSIFGISGIAAAVESSRESEILTYPGDISSITEIENYCRYPRGIPDRVDVGSFKGYLEE